MAFHPEILTRTQKRVLKQFGPKLTARGFYLAGGTALAIHLGHRRSVDFDWFTLDSIGDGLALAQQLRAEGIPFNSSAVAPDTLHGTVSSVRVSLIRYPYPLLEPAVEWQELQSALASLADLACMKLAAVAQRGSKKDFIDIYALGMKAMPPMRCWRFISAVTPSAM